MHILDPREIARNSPNVDLAKVEEARGMIRELRGRGVQRAQYNLVSPFTRLQTPSPEPRNTPSAKVRPTR